MMEVQTDQKFRKNHGWIDDLYIFGSISGLEQPFLFVKWWRKSSGHGIQWNHENIMDVYTFTPQKIE